MNDHKKQFTELEIINTVENLYPLFEQDFKAQKKITLFQEDFAKDFLLADLLKLGMVVKYAGLYEKDLVIKFKKDASTK